MTLLRGLILAGGRSRRMQRDKALLEYHGQNQVRRTAGLLKTCCEGVFVSVRAGQEEVFFGEGVESIFDAFGEVGPLGGILSAQKHDPEAAWLVVACDLPFLTTETLRLLLDRRDRQKIATAFSSSHDGLPEPLCAIYEPTSHPVLRDAFEAGRLCPRKILIEADVQLLKPQDLRALDNVNTPDEYREAVKRLQKDRCL